MSVPGPLASALLAAGAPELGQVAQLLTTDNVVVADAHMIADVRTRRGRASATDGVQAGTMTLTLVGDPATLGIEVGQPLFLRVQGSATPPRPGGWADHAVIRFAGQITDIGDVRIDPRSGVARTPITASTLLARFGNATFGRAAWVGEWDPYTIVMNTLQSLWEADPGVRKVALAMGIWDAVVWPDWNDYAWAVAPGEGFVEWDVDNQSAAQILSELMTGTGGELIERRAGTFAWLTVGSRHLSKFVTLPARWVQAPATATRRLGDLVTVARVSYGNPTATVEVRDDQAVDALGVWPASIATRYENESAALSRGTDLVARYGRPGWRLSQITIDYLAILEQANSERAGPGPDRPTADLQTALITADMGWGVELTGMPATSPVPDGRYWIVSMADTITARSWDMTLALVPWDDLAYPTRYRDVADGVTYDDVPADLTYIRSSFRQIGD